MFKRVNIYCLHQDNGNCCICLEDIKCGFKLKCGHYFHIYCITKWLKEEEQFVQSVTDPCLFYRLNDGDNKALGWNDSRIYYI